MFLVTTMIGQKFFGILVSGVRIQYPNLPSKSVLIARLESGPFGNSLYDFQ